MIPSPSFPALGRAVTCAVVLGAPLVAQGYLYKVVDLGSPGYPSSAAIDINARGEVLVHAEWPRVSYVHDPRTGALRHLGSPNSRRFVASTINDAGQVAGSAGTSMFVRTPGQGFVDLGQLPLSSSPGGTTCGLNNLGEVVGSANGLAAGGEPFLWSPAAGMQSVQQGVTGYLCDLNDAGEAIGQIGNIYGYWLRSSGATGLFVPLSFRPQSLQADGTVTGRTTDNRALVVRDRFGTETLIPTLSGQYNGWTVNGRNAAGLIVGNWQYYVIIGSSTIFRSGAFAYTPASGLVDLSPATNGIVDPAWEVDQLVAVNELGQIAGSGNPRSGTAPHALRLDPVSPAAAVTALGAGCGALQVRAAAPLIYAGLDLQVDGATPGTAVAVAVGLPLAVPLSLFGCPVHVDLTGPLLIQSFVADAAGTGAVAIGVPPDPAFLGADLAAQAAVPGTGRPLEFSNGLGLTIGF